MLRSATIEQIESFVYQKPRSIQEIASHLGKNWRTADRYVDEIEKNFGTIATRVFRGGTRGALKIAYWAAVDRVSHSVFQEQLEEAIMHARRKEDFSAFDIYQHIPAKDKRITVNYDEEEKGSNLAEFRDVLLGAQRQILFFSGNLSFVNIKTKDIDFMHSFEELVKRRVSMKVLCRVDVIGKENIEKLLSLNFKHGKEVIEIHHADQPLRAVIVDSKLFRIKEVQEPSGRMKELSRKTYLFYTIKNKEWTEWMTRIFWKLFSSSLDAHKRLEEINRIRLQ